MIPEKNSVSFELRYPNKIHNHQACEELFCSPLQRFAKSHKDKKDKINQSLPHAGSLLVLSALLERVGSLSEPARHTPVLQAARAEIVSQISKS